MNSSSAKIVQKLYWNQILYLHWKIIVVAFLEYNINYVLEIEIDPTNQSLLLKDVNLIINFANY